ncbi:hypothetical protein GCM10022226_68930 [Sphaerisporangium flaviroseum]|uniref:Cupin domain-containing protein n=1 Tax=Sphaerisporangium flaviroseum TaxID=509199 RepID=A0ABP7J7S3_9ACTN
MIVKSMRRRACTWQPRSSAVPACRAPPVSARSGPGGVQAHKLVIPPRPTSVEPDLKTHEGFEWVYVLAGRLRLLLGDQRLVLAPARSPRSTPTSRTGSAPRTTTR